MLDSPRGTYTAVTDVKTKQHSKWQNHQNQKIHGSTFTQNIFLTHRFLSLQSAKCISHHVADKLPFCKEMKRTNIPADNPPKKLNNCLSANLVFPKINL